MATHKLIKLQWHTESFLFFTNKLFQLFHTCNIFNILVFYPQSWCFQTRCITSFTLYQWESWAQTGGCCTETKNPASNSCLNIGWMHDWKRENWKLHPHPTPRTLPVISTHMWQNRACRGSDLQHQLRRRSSNMWRAGFIRPSASDCELSLNAAVRRCNMITAHVMSLFIRSGQHAHN